MATNSRIEWTEATWNPVTGCTRASAGCDLCYAVVLTRRLEAMGQEKYAGLINPGKKHFNGRIKVHPDTLTTPLRWRKPRRVFVNSMSDLFHPNVPDEFIKDVFSVMVEADRHEFQVLTKRPERAAAMGAELPWPDNVWLGTSVEDERVISRIDELRSSPAKLKFLSLEPLIGPLPSLCVEGIDWVIVGGESGPGARPISEEWVLDIRDLCLRQDVPFFFKQWGGVNKKRTGRTLEGRTWDQFPETAAQ